MANYYAFIKSRKYLFLWVLAFAINIIAIFLIFTKQDFTGDNVALRYNIKTGVFWFGSGKNLLAMPGIGFVMNIINLIIYKKLLPKYEYLKMLIVITSILIQFMLLAGLIFLTQVN